MLGMAGLGVGLIGGLGLGRLLSRSFRLIPLVDPWSLAAVLLALAAVTGLSSLLPAWRVSRADPLAVLRDE